MLTSLDYQQRVLELVTEQFQKEKAEASTVTAPKDSFMRGVESGGSTATITA